MRASMRVCGFHARRSIRHPETMRGESATKSSEIYKLFNLPESHEPMLHLRDFLSKLSKKSVAMDFKLPDTWPEEDDM